MRLTVNGTTHDVEVAQADKPLLSVPRNHLGLVDTRFGCDIAHRAACTVHVDTEPVYACRESAASLESHAIRAAGWR